MNLARPFATCYQNEDFRNFLREMLTKHGFFHVAETSTSIELMDILAKQSESHFVIIHADLITRDIIPILNKKNDFIIIGSNNDQLMLSLAASFGVKRFLSFPFSSQKLLEKIQLFT